MGAFLWIRARCRAVGVAGLVLAGAGVLVACEPDQLGPATVAYTTDGTATAELTRQHVDVGWLTCGGDRGGGTVAASAPGASAVVAVDCQGETRDRRRITVNGEVTRAVDGVCVRGDLRARVGGRQVFHVSGLGDCGATPGPAYRPSGRAPAARAPAVPRPVVTVTVTRTVWCTGDPACPPAQGK
ncbi:hypothetical protein FRZ03_26605 [Streptomyces misionensis]|uniref:Lipoprotein n=1 Tax=Streptomyces misionensis TaxID=67331 RepID=A0A5C6J3E5_9ACTN|nr:hypothetical protein [Streptomyces misionensis]TWV35570.1 hypothetical protein FRZ03_26605 [Streptomyces misionensis]